MDLQIIKIASDNKNQKILKKYTHEIKNKNSICGDEITIKLLINNKIIKDIGYDCKSCVFCQASVNLLSKKIDNMNSDKALDICNDAINIYKSKENKIVKNLLELIRTSIEEGLIISWTIIPMYPIETPTNDVKIIKTIIE